MEIKQLALEGVYEIQPKRFGDARGFFMETYSAEAFAKAGLNLNFVQDNHSYSAAKGVVRGLHYQLPPSAQDKLVRVVRGAILDVAIDIRKSSSNFGKWISLEVTAEKGNQILVPKGFAHGFVTLVEHTEVVYKVTDVYAPALDRGIRFDDPDIAIAWPDVGEVQLSDKDRKAPFLADAEVFA